MPAGRPKGAKNRRPVGEEFAKKAALLRAEARLFDKDDKLDPMQVLEEAMRHFYRKAKIEESLGRFCDFRIVDKAIETAARIAREIVSFRHPRISAIKLAVADPNADLLRGDMTADEMREIIRRKLVDEGLLPPTEIDLSHFIRRHFPTQQISIRIGNSQLYGTDPGMAE